MIKSVKIVEILVLGSLCEEVLTWNRSNLDWFWGCKSALVVGLGQH